MTKFCEKDKILAWLNDQINKKWSYEYIDALKDTKHKIEGGFFDWQEEA